MTAARSSSARLREIERILSQDGVPRPAAGASSTDPVAFHISDVPANRVARFTQVLRSSYDEFNDNDDVDLLTMRLLLNDFTVAVGHLRAVAEIAASLIDNAAKPVAESHQFLEREKRRKEERQFRQAAASEPDLGPR